MSSIQKRLDTKAKNILLTSIKALICVARDVFYKNFYNYTYFASEKNVWDTSCVGYIFE